MASIFYNAYNPYNALPVEVPQVPVRESRTIEGLIIGIRELNDMHANTPGRYTEAELAAKIAYAEQELRKEHLVLVWESFYDSFMVYPQQEGT